MFLRRIVSQLGWLGCDFKTSRGCLARCQEERIYSFSEAAPTGSLRRHKDRPCAPVANMPSVMGSDEGVPRDSRVSAGVSSVPCSLPAMMGLFGMVS